LTVERDRGLPPVVPSARSTIQVAKVSGEAGSLFAPRFAPGLELGPGSPVALPRAVCPRGGKIEALALCEGEI
jgi:hypothetical protein